MYKIRQIYYSTNSVSIQVYTIENWKSVIVGHIETILSKEEKVDLISLSNNFIEKISKQLDLFETSTTSNIIYVNQTKFLWVHFTFLFELLSRLIITIGFDKIKKTASRFS